MVFDEMKTISQWKWHFEHTGTADTGHKCTKNLELETLSKFRQHGSRSRSQTEVALHKRSDTMFEYTGYYQKTEHQEQPLTQTDHRSTQQYFDVIKTLKRETVHGPSQIATWSNLLCKRKKVINELFIINQLAKDPPCSLNKDHGPIGC